MFSFAYEAAAVIIAGFILLRLSGKKVMAEMTPLEMVTVLAVGTIIGHAVSEHEVWKTIVCMAIFIAILLLFQFLALKSRLFERLLIGRPTLVIKDGQIITKNLHKLRMTMEQMELRLRRKGISNIADVRTATIEVDGKIGFELVESAQPITRGEVARIMAELNLPLPPADGEHHNLFEMIRGLDR